MSDWHSYLCRCSNCVAERRELNRQANRAVVCEIGRVLRSVWMFVMRPLLWIGELLNDYHRDQTIIALDQIVALKEVQALLSGVVPDPLEVQRWDPDLLVGGW